MTRSYDMSLRSRLAAETTERIVDAVEALLAEGPLVGVTLKAIAARSRVTVQTVLRHMGSRDGCIEAVGRRIGERIEHQRGRSAPGDVDGAIDDLVAHYEAEGRLVLNLLAQEHGDDPLAHQAVEAGRSYHRAWVRRCFMPRRTAASGPGGTDTPLEHDEDEAERERVDALVAATDLYVWKLLRLDLGRSREATGAVLRRLVRAVLEGS